MRFEQRDRPDLCTQLFTAGDSSWYSGTADGQGIVVPYIHPGTGATLSYFNGIAVFHADLCRLIWM